MKNLLTVLKKLGKKMTSQDINGTNLVTVVDDIANKYTGGGGSGGNGDCDCTLVVGMTVDGGPQTLDKTWQEIHDAVAAGKRVVVVDGKEGIYSYQEPIIQAGIAGNQYYVTVKNLDFNEARPFTIDTATGYPVYTSYDSDPFA